MAGYIVRCPLLLVALFAAAAMAMAKTPATSSTEQSTTTPASTDEQTTTPASSLQTPALADIPPYPAPADIPPCLNDLMPCAQVYQDSSMLASCCTAVKKVFDSDRKCICDMMAEAMKNLEKLNYTGVDGAAMFNRCENMSGSSCDDKGTAGSQKTGNSVPNARSIGAFQILLLLPLFFIL